MNWDKIRNEAPLLEEPTRTEHPDVSLILKQISYGCKISINVVAVSVYSHSMVILCVSVKNLAILSITD